jgi:hypothetical protein
MGQEILVDQKIDDGEAFAREFNESYSADAVFWLHPAESDNWDLYIASNEITDEVLKDAYREVHKLIRSQKYPWLDVFRVKLLGASEPVAQKVVEIRDSRPGRTPVRYNGSSIAGLQIEGSYIYPAITTPSSAS